MGGAREGNEKGRREKGEGWEGGEWEGGDGEGKRGGWRRGGGSKERKGERGRIESEVERESEIQHIHESANHAPLKRKTNTANTHTGTHTHINAHV